MANPAFHFVVTGGISALYLCWSGKEKARERRNCQWNLKSRWQSDWKTAFALLAIFFFGFLIDIDHLVPVFLPRGMIMEGVSKGGEVIFSKKIITEPVLWLHSSYALIVAALIGKAIRSCLPFVALGSHLALDWAFTPMQGNMFKPIFRDTYVLILWLMGGS